MMDQERHKEQKTSYKGQNKMHETPVVNSSLDIKRTLYVIKKTEKLSVAIHMVTEFLSDNEPLKWKLRAESLSFFEASAGSNFMDMSYRGVITRKIFSLSEHILGLLDIANAAHMLSTMNYTVLKEEYGTLLSMLQSGDEEVENMVRLEKNFFAIPDEEVDDMREQDLPGHTIRDKKNVLYGKKGHSLDTDTSAKQYYNGHNDVKGILKKDTDAVSHLTKKEKQGEIFSRRQKILSLLNDKVEMSIKDISDIVVDCSEKTLQRELSALMKADMVKRTGKKRWSRYSLR